MMKHVVVLFLLLSGCTTSAPLLMPTATGQSVSSRESIQVIVKPITTKGFGSEDEKRLGIDLSAYFTAFDVALVNQTKEEISFSLSNIHLAIGENQKRRPLNESESIRYYREGDDPSRVVLIPKSKKKMEREILKIKKMRLLEGDLKSGAQIKGLILFKKVNQDQCRDVVLTLGDITVLRTGEKKRFSFPFSCKSKKQG